MRDLGRMGESTFRFWCDSVGLIANCSDIDKTGWDFNVEFPWAKDLSIPSDMEPSPIECKVQVKASDKQDRKIQISVANLKRLSLSPLPSFICFIEFDNKNDAQSAYLVHIGKNIIRQTLKRVREVEEKGEIKELHKKKITIHYGEDEKLCDANGESLKNKIISHLSEGVEVYVSKKHHLVTTLGFENGVGKINITLNGEGSIEDFLDLTLGIKSDIEVDKFVGHHVRFGIISKEPFVDAKRGKLSLTGGPQIPTTVTFKEFKFSPGLIFSATLFNSPLNAVVSKKYMKLRFVFDFFEIVLKPYEGTINFTFYLEPLINKSLKNYKEFFTLVTLFNKNDNELIFEVCPTNCPSFESQIRINESFSDLSWGYQTCEYATEICKRLDVDPSTIEITLDQLFDNQESIEQMYRVLHSRASDVKVEFSITSEDKPTFDTETVVSIFFSKIYLGNTVLGVFIGISGIVAPLNEERFTLVGQDVLTGPILKANIDDAGADENLKLMLESFEGEIQKTGALTVRMFNEY
ncbi:MAG: hypothetical protein ABJD02_18950 [Paraglaciecola sp.]|uniref:hypothetical protein n=2 Tax=Paraglaciecola sp. TaxID=1920173 RepID=UPI0032676DE0